MYTQGAIMGLVANGGADNTKTFTGWRLKDSGSGNQMNVLTGLTRLFSGFEKPIIKASKLYGIEYSSLIFELGNRKLVAGQEDLILEVAQKLKESK